MNRQLFCAWACTTCRWQTLAAGPPRANPELSPPLHKALQVIARGFHKELGLRQVASGASISVPHLHILFRQHLYLGGSPAKVPEERRRRYARRLLAEDDSPIAAIARSIGLSDAVSFSCAFKRRQGMTPSAYRQRYSVPEVAEA